jgi:hypothetical protein
LITININERKGHTGFNGMATMAMRVDRDVIDVDGFFELL